MLLIFEDGDEDAFLKVQGLAQSASRIELMEFRSQQSTSALEIRENQAPGILQRAGDPSHENRV